MEITSCQHKEQVKVSAGVECGECTECHQTIQYDDDHKKPTVIKLGRIGDKLVLPNPDYKLLLDPKDREDLASVRKATKGGVPQDGVPPKPETKNVYELHRYYEENKEPILYDLDTRGENAMRKRWHNMSQATFFGLMARWRPDYPGIPRWGREKAKSTRSTKRATAASAKGGRAAIATPRPIIELVLNNPSQCLTITDQDIARLVDDDFDRFWSLLGQIVKRRAKVVTPQEATR